MTNMSPEELYFSHERLVFYVLNKRFPQKQFDEDYQQLGRIGLWKASKTYDPETNNAFSSYACHCIYNEMCMDARLQSRSKRNGNGQDLVSLDDYTYSGVPLSDVVLGDNDVQFFDWEGLWGAMTEKEQDVFRRLLDGKTQIEISKELGVSYACINHRVKSIRRKWNDYI